MSKVVSDTDFDLEGIDWDSVGIDFDSEGMRWIVQNPGSRRYNGMGLMKIRFLDHTRCNSIFSVIVMLRPRRT